MSKREKPIIFNSDMVRAILEGRKTQTRRVVKPQPVLVCNEKHENGKLRSLSKYWEWKGRPVNESSFFACAKYQPGDLLWVCETWTPAPSQFCRCPQGCEPDPCDAWKAGEGCESIRSGVIYRADPQPAPRRWRPSLHMPKWAARIWLEVTGVRVERLQDISEEDAEAEGVQVDETQRRHRTRLVEPTPCGYFRDLWNSIYGTAAWDENPWVWVNEFKKVDEPK